MPGRDQQWQILLLLTIAVAAAVGFSPSTVRLALPHAQKFGRRFAGFAVPLVLAPSGVQAFVGSSRTLMSSAPREPTGVSVCYITVPNAEEADKLAGKLVESKLAACVNVIPGIQSVYTWQGKVEKDNELQELLLMVKTRTALTDKLSAFVKQNHPYDVPEVICSDITAGLPEYLNWVKETTIDP